MRVISGTARGRKLETLEGIEVRPTTDRVKEAIFSMLQFDLPGANVLDLFAGSGQLGVEALSRGAALCVFVDQSKQAHEMQKRNLQAVGLMGQARVVLNNHSAFLAGTKDRFDIVLLDPPYGLGLIPDALEALQGKVNENGLIICETSLQEDPPENVGCFQMQKSRKYGKIKITVYKMIETEAIL